MNKQDLESYVKDLVSNPEVVPPRNFRKTGELQMSQAMQDNLARCRADRSSEFHPVSMSSHSQFNVLN